MKTGWVIFFIISKSVSVISLILFFKDDDISQMPMWKSYREFSKDTALMILLKLWNYIEPFTNSNTNYIMFRTFIVYLYIF